MALIRGFDYECEDDVDPDYNNMLQSAKIGHTEQLLIWDVLDRLIEYSIRCDGLLGGLEPFCELVEDYCITSEIHDVPDLYKYIFSARGGFLTQSKAIHWIKPAWITLFPEPYVSTKLLDKDFEAYLLQNKKENGIDWLSALNYDTTSSQYALNEYISDESNNTLLPSQQLNVELSLGSKGEQVPLDLARMQ